MLPPFRREQCRIRELLGRRRVDVLPALEDGRGVADRCALEDAKWREAVGPAAVGQGGVFQREADVVGHSGVDAEDLVEGVLEVFH